MSEILRSADGLPQNDGVRSAQGQNDVKLDWEVISMCKLKTVLASLLMVGVCLSLVSCGLINDGQTKEERELIEQINSKYYNLAEHKIKQIDFQCRSEKARNVEFILRWKPGKPAAISRTRAVGSEKYGSNASLDKAASAMKAEIKDILDMMAPATDILIKRVRGVKISIKRSDKVITIEMLNKSADSKEILYFGKDLRLYRKEVFRHGKLYEITRLLFEVYENKYILRLVKRSIIVAQEIKTEMEIQYIESKGFYLPSSVTIKAAAGDKVSSDDISLTPVKIYR